MSTPDSPLPPPTTPPPAAPAATEAPKPAAPKPAFKVTRSPFAPKLGGQSAPAPISISGNAVLSSAAPSPSAARPPKPAAAPARTTASSSDKPSVVGLVIDVVAAAVAVSFTILFALNYFSA